MPSANAHVSYRAVSKSYGGAQVAIRHLDLDIRRGEFMTLLGPSGSGKTTALMMLAGFEMPSGGEIVVDGRRIDRVPANKRNIGLVFQNYALFPHMTVAENLAFPLKVRRMSASVIHERVRSLLDLVQLPTLANRLPNQLSGGQQQRVAVARALIFEPGLVLMDEPLGALDKQLREQMQFEIKAIHARLGVTFVYVTHDQTEALTMSDRIAVFNDGGIQQVATPSDLYENPQTRFVAGFIGENNRLDGHIAVLYGDGTAMVRLADGTLFPAKAGHGLSANGAVVVSVRPERARLVPDAGSMPVTLPATVRDTVYVGDHLRIVLAVPGHQAFVLKIPNSDNTLPELTRGSDVLVGWAVADGLALAA